MDNLHWQLSILSKAIHYKNLSGAASHVGLSQPQLSRIVSRLEGELGLVLLDRTARRKSGWTPIAFRIADTYFRSSRKLTQALQQLKAEGHISQISVGSLEGLAPLASEFCQPLFSTLRLQQLEMNVYDLSELEEHFEKNEFDLIFTCRTPNQKKFRHIRHLGFQSIDELKGNLAPRQRRSSTRDSEPELSVFSQFEYANHVSRRSNPKEGPVLLSNSLALRRLWIEQYGGKGLMPSEVRRRKHKETDLPVYLIGSDLLHEAVWKRLEEMEFQPRFVST